MRAAVISYAHIATFEGGVIFIYLGQLWHIFDIDSVQNITVALCLVRSEFLKCCIIVAAVVSSVFYKYFTFA